MAVPIVTICVGTQLPTAIQVQNSVIAVIIEHPLECLIMRLCNTHRAYSMQRAALWVLDYGAADCDCN